MRIPIANLCAMSFSEKQNNNSDALAHPDQFVRRHIGPNAIETAAMLKSLSFNSLDALTDAAVPKQIRLGQLLNLPAALSEFDALRDEDVVRRFGAVVCVVTPRDGYRQRSALREAIDRDLAVRHDRL